MKIKTYLIFIITAIVFLGFTGFVFAQPIKPVRLFNPLCSEKADAGACKPTKNNPFPNPPNCVCGIPQLIVKITKFVSGVVGSLAVLMFVFAGILFLVSGGSQQKLDGAKKMAIWAAIGLAVALAGAGLSRLITVIIGANPPAGAP